MKTALAPPHEAGFVRRLLIALVRTVCRYPVAVLALSAALCALSLYAAIFHLKYHTQRSDLISPHKECQQRWHDYIKEFGDDDDIVVVVKGSERARMVEALEQVAERIGRQPTLFDRLFYKADLRALHNRALMMLPLEQIRTIQKNLGGDMHELLIDADPTKFTSPWRRLSLLSLLIRAGDSLPDGQPLSAQDVQFFTQLRAVTRAAGSYLDDPEKYSNPWSSLMASEPAGQQDLLAEPQYFFSGSGGLAFLLVRPIKEEGSFTAALKSVERDARHRGRRAGLFSGPAVRPDRNAGAGNGRDGRRPTRHAMGVVAGRRRRGLAVPRRLPRPRLSAADGSHAAGRHRLGAGLADADGRPPEHPVGHVRGHADRHGRLRRAVGDALRAERGGAGPTCDRRCCTRRVTSRSAT